MEDLTVASVTSDPGADAGQASLIAPTDSTNG